MHGALREHAAAVSHAVEVELNAATDNPCCRSTTEPRCRCDRPTARWGCSRTCLAIEVLMA